MQCLYRRKLWPILNHEARYFILDQYRIAVDEFVKYLKSHEHARDNHEFLRLLRLGKEFGINIWDYAPGTSKELILSRTLPVWTYTQAAKFLNANPDTGWLLRNGRVDTIRLECEGKPIEDVALVQPQVAQLLKKRILVRMPVLTHHEGRAYFVHKKSKLNKEHDYKQVKDHSYGAIYARVLASMGR